jgi:hypothetical protein
MGFSHGLHLCLQGGGVYIAYGSGTVTISSSTISSNTAGSVRQALPANPHRPDGKVADVLAPTHACTTANASVNYRRCVQQRLKTSHRPDGIFTYSYVSRLCLQGGGVYLNGGTVSLSSCTITGNTAILVRAHAQNFPSPP